MSSVIPLYVVQNRDRIARKADYKHLEKDELLVHGMFPTLQGEGPYVGTPCVFLRLAGCNFGDKVGFCEFCDTDFALKDGKRLTFEQILSNMKNLWDGAVEKPMNTTKLMVITGGEPGLQPGIVQFIALAFRKGWMVQVETNGTQNTFAKEVREIPGAHSNLTLVISPKAGPKGYGALNKDTWAWGTNALKILVDAREDSQYHLPPEYAETEWKRHGYQVFLSPIAVYRREYKGEVSSLWDDGLINRELTSKNYNYAASLALKKGFKLSTQQHLVVGIA